MNRRKALIAMGAVCAGFLGKWIMRLDAIAEETIEPTIKIEPIDIHFAESGFKNLILERKDGREIRIPFFEIFDALEGR